MKNEPNITVNGVPLTEAQAMTVRVALGNFQFDLAGKAALGDDSLGEGIAKAYRARIDEIHRLMGLM